MLSKYNVFAENGDNTIIYNLMNKKMATVPTIVSNKMLEGSDISDLNAVKPFYISSEEEESFEREYLFKSMIYQSSRLNITLMMTMDCNFRCVYCFEQSLNHSLRTIELDEDRFIKWVIELIEKYNIQSLDLCFHGGEPLLRVDKIEKIANVLSAYMAERNKLYLFTIVTNGYLLTPAVANRLAAANVKIALITLDGMPEVHNKRRILANGDGSFQQIFDNIKNNDSSLRIYVGFVYDSENIDSLYNLVEYMSEEGLTKKIQHIAANTTKPVIDKENKLFYNEYSGKKEAYSHIALLKKIMDCGFKIPFPLDYQLCTYKQKSSFILAPDLSIYKCISGVCVPEFRLHEGELDIDPFALQAKIIERTPDEACMKCKYNIICNGNCMYDNYVMQHKICNRSYFDAFVPEFLKLISDPYYRIMTVFDGNAKEWEE